MAIRKIVTHLDLNKNEIQNVKGQNLSSTPSGVVESQFWYDTVNHTMKFYNGTTAIDMGAQGALYSAGTGINIVNNVISVTAPTIVNEATSSESVALGVSATSAITSGSSVSIGYHTYAEADHSTAIGYKCMTNSSAEYTIMISGDETETYGAYSVNIGYYSYSNGDYSVTLGYSAVASADYAYQIGQGSNSDNYSLYIGFGDDDESNALNYKLLDGLTGKIPNDRLTIDSSPTSASTNAIQSGAVYTALGNKVTANNAITSGTKCKITYDSKGLVTSGADLAASDIPDISATYVTTASKGVANGVASLDNTGKVPSSQLPSYVDDIVDAYIVSGATALTSGWLSDTDGGSALTPETGKIYVVLTSGDYQNKTYRWSGSTYVEVGGSPAQASESTAGIAAIATQSEVNTGTNDTKFVTPLKLATYVGNKKVVVTNGSLTASGGTCIWTISTTLAPNCIVSVRETSGGAEVYTDVTYGSGSITIKINSTSTIAAGTYTAVILG